MHCLDQNAKRMTTLSWYCVGLTYNERNSLITESDVSVLFDRNISLALQGRGYFRTDWLFHHISG